MVNYFCQGHLSLKNQVFSRYHKFVTKLINSLCKEIRILVNLVKSDKRSVTGRNIAYISDMCGVNILKLATWQVKKLLPEESKVEPWRSSLLTSLFKCRWNNSEASLNLTKGQCEDMIKSLCIS